MSEESVSIEISSSWESGNEKDLRDAITLEKFSAAKRDEDGALTDMVELESCVLLTQPREENGNNETTSTSTQPCSVTLRLKCKSPIIIANVVIACEAKLIEVYGAQNEYLKTVSSELVDKVDDMAVYCADIAISQLTQNCTLKFARLNRPSDMWLYGVKVIWNVVDNFKTVQSQSGLNFESVEQRLKESQTQLSGRAENCKNFLKMYSSLNDRNKSALGFSDPLSLLSLLPGMSGNKRTGGNSFLNTALQSMQPQGSGDMAESTNSFETMDRKPENASHSCCDKLESMLQSHLTSMENRLMKALDERLALMQQRQEQQFQSLFNLVSQNTGAPIGVRCGPKDKKDCSVVSDQDLKIEQAIKNMMDQVKNKSSYAQGTRNYIGGTNENVLRNAFMSLKFNEVLEGTSHSANSNTAVQGNS